MLLKRLSKHETNSNAPSVVYDETTGLEVAGGAYLAATRDRRILPMYELYSEAMDFSQPPTTEHFMKDLTRCIAILYPSDGRLAGLCLWHVACKRTAEVVALSVEAEHRRDGIGSAMMQAAIRGMDNAGARDIIVASLATTEAMGFYKQQGFEFLHDEAPGARHAITMHRTV